MVGREAPTCGRMACLAALALLALEPAAGFSFAAPLRGGAPAAAAAHRMTLPLGARTMTASSTADGSIKRPIMKQRLIQHKAEALWFYRYLSIVYDKVVNPGHWTEEMRKDSLVPAELNSPDLDVVDVGGGTGFCTIGIVEEGVKPERITLMDQSPHQLEKARAKDKLKGVTIIEGDAEDLPFETDSKDRYVSAGSIEYWPDPQRGICESYRVIKPGGLACCIGPVHPTFPPSQWFADLWMLFPTEAEYIEWFTKAGFEDVKITRIGPWWYHGVRRHGLIMGCSVTGRKPLNGPSMPKLQLGKKAEPQAQIPEPFGLTKILRLILGTLGGFYYFLVPVYMLLKHLLILPLTLVWKDAHKRLM